MLTMVLTRLAEEGDFTASGVAYAIITMPVFDFAIVQILKKASLHESALLGSLLVTFGTFSFANVCLLVCMFFCLSFISTFSSLRQLSYSYFSSMLCGVHAALPPPQRCATYLILPGIIGCLPHSNCQDRCSFCPYQPGVPNFNPTLKYLYMEISDISVTI